VSTAPSRRLVVIGLDGGMFSLADRFMQTGAMPHLARLAARGTWTPALPSIPVDTPTNWTTIMTGAEPATHGVYSFTSHTAGEPFETGPLSAARNKSSAFSKAEFLWNALEGAGYRCAVINYPTGWPSTMSRGVVVGGVTPGGEPWRLAKPAAFVAGTSRAIGTSLPAIKFQPKALRLTNASGWTGAPHSRVPALEATLAMTVAGVPYTVHALFVDTVGGGYDRVIVSRDRDAGTPIATMSAGEWSSWITERFGGEDGVFRIKLAHLSPDGRDVEIYVTDVFRTRGWTHPDGLESGIIERAGPYFEGFECPYVPFDVQTRPYGPVNVSASLMLDHARIQAKWMVEAAGHLRAVAEWDALILHFHYLDALNHTYLGYLYDKFPTTTPTLTRDTWDLYAESYRLVDDFVGRLVAAHADDRTVVVVTSDHAALPCWRYVAVAQALARAGLLAYDWDDAARAYRMDLAHSKAIPYLDPQHVWINLAGREPDGIVAPDQYEATREAVIDALRNVRDPQTGEAPIAVAARREDLGVEGKAQERAGDVLFFLRPGYTTWDGTIGSLRHHEASPEVASGPLVTAATEVVGHHTPHLPNARLEGFHNGAMTLFAGPGVRQGQRRPRPIRLVDLAPTTARLLGVPAPRDNEGRALDDIAGGA
jgi:predicted AlkP superfamily phosphohydrolase/phosphomutase